MKKALMVIAIIAIIAITGSLIYYYVFFRPGIEKSSQVKEYLSEYNAIRQEFIDKLNSKDKDKILTELQEIRRKLIRLSVPEGYNKYNDVKISCLTAMNECIDVYDTIRIFDAVGTEVDDNIIKELVDKEFKNKRILESLSINE